MTFFHLIGQKNISLGQKPEWYLRTIYLSEENGKNGRENVIWICDLERRKESWHGKLCWLTRLPVSWVCFRCLVKHFHWVLLSLLLHFFGHNICSFRKSPCPSPQARLEGFTADSPVCVWVHGLLLLFSCFFFMTFQLIHHTPCALEWNSTHTNPWRLKKSSPGIFLFVCMFNVPLEPARASEFYSCLERSVSSKQALSSAFGLKCFSYT